MWLSLAGRILFDFSCDCPFLTAVQVEAYNSQDDKAEMPVYNLPPKILCEVVYAQLKVYKYSFFFNRQFCKIKINKSKLDPE